MREIERMELTPRLRDHGPDAHARNVHIVARVQSEQARTVHRQQLQRLVRDLGRFQHEFLEVGEGAVLEVLVEDCDAAGEAVDQSQRGDFAAAGFEEFEELVWRYSVSGLDGQRLQFRDVGHGGWDEAEG